MRLFRDASIRTKLVLLMAGLVSFIVLLVCAAFVVNGARAIRTLLIERHSAVADAIAADSSLPLSFQLPDLASEVLSSLSLDPAVNYACLVDSAGQVFASYPENSEGSAYAPAKKARGVYFNDAGELELYQDVSHEGEAVGTVYLRASMQQVDEAIRRDLYTATIVLGISLISVVLLTTVLQRIISDPILRLADAARRVSTVHDYSIRVAKSMDDELGILSDGFNTMLAEIQARDGELRSLNENLEERVQERAAELQREQYLLNSLVDNIPDPVFFKDRQGRFIRVNQAMAIDAGVDDPADLIGKTDRDVWGGTLPAETEEDERRILETGEPLISKEEQSIAATGTEHWVLVTKMPLRNEAGEITGIFGIARDITARKQQELERERQAAALAQAKEALELSNADLQQFAYVASHDLQEPLRAVAGYCQLLEAKLSDSPDEEVRTYLQHATEGAKRMQALINSLLDYARVETQGKSFRLVEMRKAVADALTNLSTSLDECGADVKIGDLPTVFGDRDQLARLFQNLVGNALKFRGEMPPRIQITAEEVADSWRISVCDNGIGLEQQYSERIFIIFQRLHTRGQFTGTGLGLAISKRIVERHGGRIWVESEPGQGCTFYFTLPKPSNQQAAVHD